MAACQPLPSTGFVSGVLDFIDCQARAIGAEGYQALAAPGSTLSLVLTGLLTLFVALFGYRMLFGHVPGVREGVLALVKIGVVLALATGWSAYRTLVYDVALDGPAELATEIGVPAALPGAGGGLVARLDYADRALVALGEAGVGPGIPVQPAPGSAPAPPALSFDSLAFGGARVLYLTGAVGAPAAVRLVAGLVLALGPFFVAFLLFEGTRGLFEGWLRVLAGTALGAIGTAVVLGVELALLEPWLADLLSRRATGLAIAGAPIELLVATLVFALVLLATLIGAARVAYGFRLPPAWRAAPAQLVSALRGDEMRVAGLIRAPGSAAADRPRAAALADSVAATQRREAAPGAAAAAVADSGPPSRQATRHTLARDLPAPQPIPLGRSFPRRTRPRPSAVADRRDRGA